MEGVDYDICIAAWRSGLDLDRAARHRHVWCVRLDAGSTLRREALFAATLHT
jgi:hypothetical protein